MGLKELVKESFDELMKEMSPSNDDVAFAPPTKSDVSLGDASSQLAKSKGELAALLNKAERAGAIKKINGKITIIDVNQYKALVGDLPKRIKMLQAKLEPEQTPDEEI